MLTRIGTFASCGLLSLLAGCAGTTYGTIPNSGNPAQADAEAAADAAADGIRYYDAAPFVLVYTDGKGGINSSLVYLPDTTRKRLIKPYAWAAKNHSTIHFKDGVLTDAKAVVDETVLPLAVIDAAKQIALKGLAMDGGGGGSSLQVPPPALFRVFVDPKGNVRLRGGYGTDADGNVREIDVTVVAKTSGEGDK